jgi:hypothetical protein
MKSKNKAETVFVILLAWLLAAALAVMAYLKFRLLIHK